MQHLPQIDLARRASGTICPTCYQRPPHSETLGPTIARSCEPQCPVFKYIDRLMVIAGASATNAATDYDLAIRDDVCNKRCTAPTAGDYCSERLHGTCPLEPLRRTGDRRPPDAVRSRERAPRTFTTG